MHFQKFVQVRDILPCACGNALFAACLQKVRVGPFPLCHGLDQRDLAFDHLVIKPCIIKLLLHLGHARHHRHHALHPAHFQHLL